MSVIASHLSKKYQVSHLKQGENRLTDSFQRLKQRLLRPEHASGSIIEDFWALQDLNFIVKPGDRIGLVGANGAGKSTLLKILSRITPPTKGTVQVEGRVGSLLEVGAGFHPDLTGRENIQLNGAILGLSKSQIAQKFDAIVSFAEIEHFLDVPIKRYSSGMRAKLGFSIAVHVDPDILIVDEVLAVGDLAFQKKCLERMESFGKEGKTLFFVGHQIPPLLSLCNRGLYLKEGKLEHEGTIAECIERYTAS